MMRNFLFLFLIGLFSLPGMAQTERLRQLTVEGKKAFVEKKGLNPMSFSSDGARVRVKAEIYDPERHLLWKSQRYQGNATLFTGFGALEDAMRKLVRKALGKELSGIEREEE